MEQWTLRSVKFPQNTPTLKKVGQRQQEMDMKSKGKDFPQNNAMSNVISDVLSMGLFGENQAL